MKRWLPMTAVMILSCGLAAGAEPEQEQPVRIPPGYEKLVADLNTRVKQEGPHVSDLVFKYRLPTSQELRDYPALWEFLPPERNAAFVYARAIMHYDRSLEPPAGSKSSAESYLGNIGAFREYVEKRGRAIDYMKEAAAYEQCSFPVVDTWVSEGKPGSSYVGVQLAGVREMARTLSDAAFVAEESGDPTEAAELCLTGLRMGKHIARGDVLCVLVGVACTAIARDTVERVMANNDLPEMVLRDIVLEAQHAELSHSDLRKSCEMGQAQHEYELSQPHFDLSDYFDPAPSKEQAMTAVQRVYGNAQRLLERSLEQLLDERENLEQLLGEGVEKHPYSEFLIEQFVRLLARVREHNARLRLLRIRAAIVLYEAEHGQPPANLDELAPKYLKAVPPDPFTGKPFRYLTLGNAWKAYSVGRNGKDDGGLSRLPPYAYELKDGVRLPIEWDIVAKSRVMSMRLDRISFFYDKDSVSAVAKALSRNPEMADLYYARSDMYDGQHPPKKEEALKDLGRAINLDPDHVYALRFRADLLFDRDQYERAVEDLTMVIELDPFHGIEGWPTNPFHARAWAYTKLRRYDEAWADVQMCRRINYPVDPKLMAELKANSDEIKIQIED